MKVLIVNDIQLVNGAGSCSSCEASGSSAAKAFKEFLASFSRNVSGASIR